MRARAAAVTPQGAFVAPKSRAGKRRVPLTAELRAILAAHLLRTGRREGLLLGDGERPLDPRSVARRSATAWKRAGVRGIGLHECRHSFASCAVAAGVSPIVVARILGHADGGALVFARYGHALEGAEAQAAETLSRFMAERAATG